MLRDADRIIIALLVLVLIFLALGFDTVFRFLASPRMIFMGGGPGGGEEVPQPQPVEEPDDRAFADNVTPLKTAEAS